VDRPKKKIQIWAIPADLPLVISNDQTFGTSKSSEGLIWIGVFPLAVPDDFSVKTVSKEEEPLSAYEDGCSEGAMVKERKYELKQFRDVQRRYGST
jgi:hypothetical protein